MTQVVDREIVAEFRDMEVLRKISKMFIRKASAIAFSMRVCLDNSELTCLNHTAKIRLLCCAFLCSSPSIYRVIQSRRMKWRGHLTHMAEI